jgi:hypothetical protein
MMDYNVHSPVLFLIFNRPDITFKTFAQIKKAKPTRLYIAADGPRQGNPNDYQLCLKARSVIKEVNWDCNVQTLVNETNKGCKIAVSSAISWFFSQEEEGIILEDDCLPANSFFFFCDALLARYRNDSRIYSITGTNLQKGLCRGNASYYFSQYSNIWGWASWKRVWEKYDPDLKKYNEEDVALQLKKVFSDTFLISDWLQIFKDLKSGKIDTWDYQLNFLTYFENGLCVTPNVNLISNIGFREDATHTPDPSNHNANLPTGEITEIIHPEYFLPDIEADYFFIKKEFNLDERWMRYNKKTKRFKRWVKKFFN